MARVTRLSGAILAETQARYFLVGNPKEPCAWECEGFADPGVVDAHTEPFRELAARGTPKLTGPLLLVRSEGEALAKTLAERLLIRRNGSVSERLWNLVWSGREPRAGDTLDADWLLEMPNDVWHIVQDSVLRCV